MKEDHDHRSVATIAPSFFAHLAKERIDFRALPQGISYRSDVRRAVRETSQVKVAEVRHVTQHVLDLNIR